MIPDEAHAVLQKVFGYPSFKEGQEPVVDSLISRRDTLAVMPTGAGKSICYQLPSLLYDGVTLVVSPLIALMKDQVDALGTLGVPATFINSSLKASEIRQRMHDAAQGRYKLLYVAPERLEAEGFLELAEKMGVSFLAVDEAHCVSQWGHDFRPSYKKIYPFIKSLPKRPLVGAFTATATPEIKQDIINLLGLLEPNVFVTGFDRENLYLSVLRGENKKEFVLDYLAAHPGQSGIVYAATRKDVDLLYELLQKNNVPCGRYHAGMREAQRAESQDAFLRDDLPVMVSTNAFGMGIDKSNVRFVIHYNMTKNMEAYYQEAGRAGRDGEPGECILLFGPQDVLLQKFLIEQTVYSPKRRSHEFAKLQAVSDYCFTSRCLRQYILDYFGEQNSVENCGNCLNCRDDRQSVDVTREAQMVLSCVVRMKERYGAVLVAEVLKGAKNKRIRQFGLERLSTYGLLAEWSLQEIKDLIGFMTAEGYLRLTEGKFPLLKTGPQAAAVIREGKQVRRKILQPQEVQTDDALFERLRQLRKGIADRENIPPYIVFSDATLREMSERTPVDEQSMLRINGVGETKLERYGEEFLQLIRQYTKNN
ncbi:MAG: DNA helicase RecQ [Bacillota bacterium]|nr:DNA helicase RecQ [Bacillota bacterium]MDW7682720.1 DNA helicase RecQ [Bacillota bacterium]